MHQTSSRRNAFTLVELLVVIAIIAILMAMLAAGVMAVLARGPVAVARNDLMQISQGMQRFHAEYKFYPPSKIILRSNLKVYALVGTPLDKQSLQVIMNMWPNIDPNQSFNWGGAGNDTLEGDQCLVFFLGGIPVNGIPSGFATNPQNPTLMPGNPLAGTDRKRFLEFDASRIGKRANAPSPFPSYFDPWKQQPYVYFSSNKRADGYDATTPISTMPVPVAPYYQSAGKFWNSSTFQLICAGPDGVFGPGGMIWPGPVTPTGMDDMSNFTDAKLGAAP